MSRITLTSRISLLFVTLIAALLLTGCGGGGGTSSNSRAGHYTSTVPLTGSQTGDLDITVAENGQATGTLKVNDPNRTAATRSVTLTVNLSGTVNSAGQFDLTGTYTTEGGTQTVHVTGDAGNGGAAVLNYINQNFNGTWTFTGNATPGGGGANATFTNASGTNAITSALTLPLVAGAITNLPIVGKQTIVTASPAAGDMSRVLSFGVRGNITAGQTFTIDDDAYAVTYSEGVLSPTGKQWHATGGTIEIVTASSTSISFRIRNATMSSVTSGATGTFTISADGETTAVASN